jgi:hypothetical protein
MSFEIYSCTGSIDCRVLQAIRSCFDLPCATSAAREITDQTRRRGTADWHRSTATFEEDSDEQL